MLPDSVHVAVHMYYVEVCDSAVADCLARLGLTLFYVAALCVRVNSQHLAWLELVALSADHTDQPCLFTQILHLLQDVALCSHLQYLTSQYIYTI